MTTEPHTPSLYPFQRQALQALIGGKHFIVMATGAGKSAVAMKFVAYKAIQTGKHKALVVTTASKSRTSDFEDEYERWTDDNEKGVRLEVISWHKLNTWVNQHYGHLGEYIYVFDEAARCAGYTTGMGKAFLKITRHSQSWAGFTATPGDTWDKFVSYFVATGKVRNKTQFLNTYAVQQTFKGFPEIVGWRHEDELKRMWADISYAPDTSQMERELPEATHKVVEFKPSKSYRQVLKTRQTSSQSPTEPNSEPIYLDTPGALTAELRRQCFTKDKQQWVSDFIEGLGTGAVVFYNFVKTGDELEQIINKALPKGARLWRIDGKHHEIPGEGELGDRDVVLCQWQSGSEGLNLQALHYWVSVEPHYAYSTSIQARGRIRRLNQRHIQRYFYLKTVGTIEDSIYQALKNKSDFAADVWCQDNNLIMKGE